jgi:Arc/MetJ family transcription regulator
VGEVAGSNPVVPTIFLPSRFSLLCVKTPSIFFSRMKLKIDIDDKLMRLAMRGGKYRTRKAAIEAGLRLLILDRQTGIRRLRGKIAWEGNLEESRLGRNIDQ